MATITKTYVENGTLYPDKKATWTLSITGTDKIVNDNFIFEPTLTAKYVFTGKTDAMVDNIYSFFVDGYNGTFVKSIRFFRGEYTGGFPSGFIVPVPTTSGVVYEIPPYPFEPTEEHEPTEVDLSIDITRCFNSSNSTKKYIDLYLTEEHIELESWDSNSFNGYTQSTPVNSGIIARITLDAPPTFDKGSLHKDTDQYVSGITTVYVDVSNSTAFYGGSIVSSELIIGSQSVSGLGNGRLSLKLENSGTFIPQVSVTDSRGQTTTKSLDSITVNSYFVPSVTFDVYRTDEYGIKDDEGHYGLIISEITYSSDFINLIEPSVSIDGVSLNNITGSSIVWYSDYSTTYGVSSNDIINDWSDISSGSTVYGLIDCNYDSTDIFSEDQSYQVTLIANDSNGGHSTPITQNLSVAFYTIDFQAGGKEIAFGSPANDIISNYPNGLFKCNMDTDFKDMTFQEIDDFIDSLDIY